MENGQYVILLWVILAFSLYYLYEIHESNEKDVIIEQKIELTPEKNLTKVIEMVFPDKKPIIVEEPDPEPEIEVIIIEIEEELNETIIIEPEIEIEEEIVETETCIKIGTYNHIQSKEVANKIHAINQQRGFILIQLNNCVICLNPNLELADWSNYIQGMGITLGYELHYDYCKLLT